MDINEIRQWLLWSTLIHYTVLILWFGSFVFARDWMRRLHGRWFALPPAAFGVIHYAGMGLYKLLIAVFSLIPLIALMMVG